MEERAKVEAELGKNDLVTDMNREIYELEAIADNLEESMINAQEFNLLHLGDDDDFGENDGDEFY